MLSVVEVMATTKQLEDQLLDLSQERDELEKELAKMPPGAGRTIKGRQRKMVVEQRLDDLGVEISRVRIEIKKLNGQTKR
jgi:flagellar biosynthesis chaperone FliJ